MAVEAPQEQENAPTGLKESIAKERQRSKSNAIQNHALSGQNGQNIPPVVFHAVVAPKHPCENVMVAIPAREEASEACLVKARIAQLGRAGLHLANAPLHAAKERNQEGELAKTEMIALVRKSIQQFVS